MAERKNAVSENVPGKFYVDDQCIHCGICVDTAPKNFQYNDEDTHAYVYKQPETKEEETNSIQALEACPANAIGKD